MATSHANSVVEKMNQAGLEFLTTWMVKDCFGITLQLIDMEFL